MSTDDEVAEADAKFIEGPLPPSVHVALNRGRIIETALTLIANNGLPGMTMRRLGAQLNVEAMSLYRYVTSKEDLLDGVVDELVQSMKSDPQVLSTPQHGWEDFLQRLAHGVRRVALLHPMAFPLVASRPPEASWLRPPLGSLDWVETFLSGLVAEGFTDEAAAISYRAFTSFLLGHLLLEVATHGAGVGPLDVPSDPDDKPEALNDYRTVRRLRRALSIDDAATEFDEALESLLDRLALVHAEQPHV